MLMETETVTSPPLHKKVMVSLSLSASLLQSTCTETELIPPGPSEPASELIVSEAVLGTLACQLRFPPPVFWRVSVFGWLLIKQLSR
jgi:hypothetical protein